MPWDDDKFIEHELDDGPTIFERPHGIRFGEGQSINRRGRPRGSPNMATIVKRVAKLRHRVMIDDKAQTKSTIELLILALQKKAAEGNLRAVKLQQSLLQRFGPMQVAVRGVLIGGEKLNADEWEAVYGIDYTDDEFAQCWPYLVQERKRLHIHRVEVEALTRTSQEKSVISSAGL